MTSVGVLTGAAPSSQSCTLLKLAMLSPPRAIDRSRFCNLSGWLPQLLDGAPCVAGEISTVGRHVFGAWFVSSGYVASSLLL